MLEPPAILVADDQYQLSPEYIRNYIDNLIQQILVIIDCNEITPGAGC